MPTNDDLFYTAALRWLRGRGDHLRGSVMSRRPAVRWTAALLAIIGLTSAIYWVATSYSILGTRYLVSGRRFSSDDLIKVCTALDKHRVNYRVDDSRRVEVAADQYDQAAEVVTKLEIGQPPISDIREKSYIVNFLDSSSDRENRKQLAREKIIEGLIGQLDGVVWSLVSIDRPPSSRWARAGAKPKAFVYIETEANRQLPYQTAQSIPAILTGCVSDLTPGSITVMDRRGFRYYDSGNLAIGDASRDRAREEDLVKDILDKLDWIKGVRVQVKVSRPARPAADPAIAGLLPRQPVTADHIGMPKLGASPGKLEPGSPILAMRVNQPPIAEPDAEPEPPATAVPITAPADGPGTNSPAAAHPEGSGEPRAQEPGRVLIYVPRSFYLNADIRPANREPTRDELRSMAERTENQIKTAVGLATPSTELWKVDVFTIPDELSLNRPVNLEAAADARRKALDWGIVGTVVAGVSILAALGSWIQVARRPVPASRSTLEPRRYHVDTASEPGPSERVRELVRRSPEAAASVLQRWTGQGGRV